MAEAESLLRPGLAGRHQVAIALADEVYVGYLECLSQKSDPLLPASQRCARLDGRLELDEVPQAIDLVEVNPDALPKEEVTLLEDHRADAECLREGGLHLVAPLDRGYPVATLALVGQIRPTIRDQVCRAARFLAKLEASNWSVKVRVALR